MKPSTTPLPPDVFEAIVTALAQTLASVYRARSASVESGRQESPPSPPVGLPAVSPWLTAKDAAARARCSVKILYRAVNGGRLRAVKIGAGRNMRFRAEWVDEWLQRSSMHR
jgi:excisionase family DNA binding protein